MTIDGSKSDQLRQPGRGLHSRVVDLLGTAICAGDLASESIIRIEELEERLGVSRSVVREVLRVLASMGMIRSTQRIGVQVLPTTEWNLYDPQVIRWRLASPDRALQLRSLTELRTAIEPEAARLAALRSREAEASSLSEVAGRLWAAGQAADTQNFLELDILFHRMVLSASGNEMFAKLDTVIAEVLSGRTHYGLMPSKPHDEALQLHLAVAASIQAREPEKAQTAMLRIMQRTLSEMHSAWTDDEPTDH